MNNKEKLLELSLYSYADVNKALTNKLLNISPELNPNDIFKFLKSKKLDTLNKRLACIWDLESEIEKIILDNIHLSDEILILDNIKRVITEKYPQLDMSEDTFKIFMRNRNFKGINNMRSFVALCEGDIDECKMYSTESDTIAAYSILRTLIILNEYNETNEESKSDIISDLTNKIIDHLYKGSSKVNVNKMMNLSFRHKDFLLSDYRDYIKTTPALYLEGVLKVIKLYFESNNLMNKYNELIKAYENLYSSTEKINKNNDSNIVKEVEKIEEKIDDVELENVSIDDLVSTNEIEPEIMEDVNCNEVDEKIENDTKDSSTTLENIKLKAQELLNLVDELENTKEEVKQAEVNNNSIEVVSELEKENERLRNEIEILKRRVSDVSLKDFIKQVGGRECGYQLSELYMLCEGIIEDDGNIPGRLINLFGMLENNYLEAFTEDKEINQEFEIDRKTLSQKYMLEMPLRGDDEIIKVKLIKNGWKYNGEIIVSPLVRQII